MRPLPVRFVWSQRRWRGRSRRSAGNLPALAEPGQVARATVWRGYGLFCSSNARWGGRVIRRGKKA